MNKMKLLFLGMLSVALLCACGQSGATSEAARVSSIAEVPYSIAKAASEIPDFSVPSEVLVEPGANSTVSVIKASYTGDFSMVGMWKTSGGVILSFDNNGQCSPTLFGFEGGPNGSYAISGTTDENGCYTLQASHITGGNLVYLVSPQSADEVTLTAQGETYFGASKYVLTRM